MLFLLLALLQGIQQEIVRAVSLSRPSHLTVPRTATSPGGWRFMTAALPGFAAVSAALFLVLRNALPTGPSASLATALALGLPFLMAHQVFNGVLAGRRMWGFYAASLVAEATARFLVVVALVSLGAGIVGQTWALVFGGLGWFVLAGIGRVRAAFSSLHDVDPRVIVSNAGKSLVATASSALLINAFPVLLQISVDGASSAEAGVVIAAVILTRAPLMMPLYALQGMLIGAFTGRRGHLTPLITRVLLAVTGLTAVGAFATAVLGPWILELVFGAEYEVSGALLAALIAAAGLTAALTLAGWAAMAAGRLWLYAAAWLSAPVTASVMLAIDQPIAVRAGASLILGPLVGLSVLGVGSLFGARRQEPV